MEGERERERERDRRNRLWGIKEGGACPSTVAPQLYRGGSQLRARRDQQVSTSQKCEMCSGSEEGSYLRLTDLCITQL